MKTESNQAEQNERLALAQESSRRYGRELLADASCRVGDEAVVKIVLPVIERVMRGDIEIVDLEAGEDKGLVKVLRTAGLAHRLRKIGLSDDLSQIALRFSRDFAAARMGGLTASYDGVGGGKRASEPERWAEAMDLLSKASAGPSSCPLTQDERVALYGYVLFDVSAADLGAFIGDGVVHGHKFLISTGKLTLVKALKKLAFFYEDWDERHKYGPNAA